MNAAALAISVAIVAAFLAAVYAITLLPGWVTLSLFVGALIAGTYLVLASLMMSDR